MTISGGGLVDIVECLEATILGLRAVAGSSYFFGCCRECVDDCVYRIGCVLSLGLGPSLAVVVFSFCCLFVSLQPVFEFRYFARHRRLCLPIVILLFGGFLASTCDSVRVSVVFTVVTVSVC